MAFVPYPPVNISQAISVFKQDVELAHGIVHGDENTEVLTENGLVPSFKNVIEFLKDEVASATGVDVSLRSDLADSDSSVPVGGVEARVISNRQIDLVKFAPAGGVIDATSGFQDALNAATEGQWIDGANKTFLISSEINFTSLVFRLRNCKLVFPSTYSAQGSFNIQHGSGFSPMTVDIQNVVVDGGRDTYKTGLEPWVVFAALFGYESIEPTLPPLFKVTAYSPFATVNVSKLTINNLHANAGLQVGTFGVVTLDGHVYRNCSNKSYAVFHSPDDGVTQGGRTIVSNIYTENIGLLPDSFLVGGVTKPRSDPYTPQGSFNCIVSHGDYTLTNCIVYNYGSTGVCSDRNRSFTYSNVFIYHDDPRGLANNPSGAFWAEDTNTVNGSNLTVWVEDRDPRDYAMDSCLLQLFCLSGSQTIMENTVLIGNNVSAKVNKLVRGSMTGNAYLELNSLWCYGLSNTPASAVSFLALPNSAALYDVRVSNGYLDSGDVEIECPHNFDLSSFTVKSGNVYAKSPANLGVTQSNLDFSVKDCKVSGNVQTNVGFSGSVTVADNKRIGGDLTLAASSGSQKVTGNHYIGGSITASGSSATVGTVDVSDNLDVVGLTIITQGKRAKVSGNGTRRRIEIKDVQTFTVTGNDAKTDQAEPVIWVNPITPANVIAGNINGNNVLIKTGTDGAGYVEKGLLTQVTDTNNNKLTVSWS